MGSFRARGCVEALAVCMLLSGHARAGSSGEESADGGVVPALVAVVPGFLLHGAGHAAAGDWPTAWRLLGLQGIGLTAFLGGGGLLVATGADRHSVGVTSALALHGFSLVLATGLADLYGAATGLSDLGRFAGPYPAVQCATGARGIWDPLFDHHGLAVLRAAIVLGSWLLEPEAWVALDANNQRFAFTTSYRAWQPEPSTLAADGSWLDMTLVAADHRYREDGFSMTSLAFQVEGRYDLQRVAPTLAGTFAETSLGLAAQFFDYAAPGRRFGEDVRMMLLSRVAFGLYLGHATEPQQRGSGEVAFFYDHRKDGYVAGLASHTGGGGFLGHAGVTALLRLGGGWALGGEFVAGAAYMGGVDVIYEMETW